MLATRQVTVSTVETALGRHLPRRREMIPCQQLRDWRAVLPFFFTLSVCLHRTTHRRWLETTLCTCWQKQIQCLADTRESRTPQAAGEFNLPLVLSTKCVRCCKTTFTYTSQVSVHLASICRKKLAALQKFSQCINILTRRNTLYICINTHLLERKCANHRKTHTHAHLQIKSVNGLACNFTSPYT